MQITGTVSANATVTETKSGKNVVNFFLEMSESYKDKAGERKWRNQQIRCAVWNRPQVAKILTKGTSINATGWLEDPNVWITSQGEAKAGLAFTVREVSVIGKVVKNSPQPIAEAMPVSDTPPDDLPF